MYRVGKTFSFEAAHQLPLHKGQCKNLHGHSYKVTIVVQSDHLKDSGSSTGMVIDFSEIKEIFKPIVDSVLDHQYLNDSLFIEHPTAENIAYWLYQQIKPSLPELYLIRVQETETSFAEYFENV